MKVWDTTLDVADDLPAIAKDFQVKTASMNNMVDIIFKVLQEGRAESLESSFCDTKS